MSTPKKLKKRSLNSQLWSTLKTTMSAKTPPPDKITVEKSATDAKVILDLRDQGLGGYVFRWDTGDNFEQGFYRDASFGKWKLRSGEVLTPDEAGKAFK